VAAEMTDRSNGLSMRATLRGRFSKEIGPFRQFGALASNGGFAIVPEGGRYGHAVRGSQHDT
jgi:hypothetical protein